MKEEKEMPIPTSIDLTEKLRQNHHHLSAIMNRVEQAKKAKEQNEKGA